MDEPTSAQITGEFSPDEFFKRLVEEVCQHQRLNPAPLTSYYLVKLLSSFSHLGTASAGQAFISDKALAIRFHRDLLRGGKEQRDGLKAVGDVSLVISGFFPDSLRRSLVDVDYYISLGGQAYGLLANTDHAMAPTFQELSDKFVHFVDVLAEVSVQTNLTDNRDLLRLYESWLRRRDKFSRAELAKRGIPMPYAQTNLRSIH